ncbi:molybdopterin synthase catalytic subunit MoaE [Pseudomonas leptonychotis]|uniref:molybdopterin synthase catalytic subunit MoaE n=1 Tax=Pseudomonas leptonychotis TaxID=2448482 RepID=UPI0039EEB4BB
MSARVHSEVFDAGELLNGLHGRNQGVGAVVSFVGYVRDYSEAHAVHGLFLEHYPGMTEKALAAIETEARARWPLLAVEIVHRVGQLLPGAPIVFVGVSSAHRQPAFEACAFIMDYLKTRAPFWKKEHDGQAQQWVEARASDQHAAQRWSEASSATG